MTEQHESMLSKRGSIRREEMLTELLDQMQSVHRRRRLRHRAIILTMAIAFVAGVSILMLPRQPAQPHPSAGPSIAQQPPATNDSANRPSHTRGVRIATVNDALPRAIEVIADHATTTMRTVCGSSSLYSELIDDATLVATLHATGRSVGLVRIGGDTVLITDASDETLPSQLPIFRPNDAQPDT